MKIFPISKAMDWAASKIAEAWIRKTISKYAELKDLRLDSAAKKLRLLIQLKGEAADIEFTITEYVVTKENKNYSVTVSQIDCSREWIRLIAVDQLIGKKFQIPWVAAKVL